MVAPVSESDYVLFQDFRDHIYADRALMDLGVERKRMFVGHISLFYIEKKLEGTDGQELSEAVTGINRRFFKGPLPYQIKRAEVRKFKDFLAFNREENWPAYFFE